MPGKRSGLSAALKNRLRALVAVLAIGLIAVTSLGSVALLQAWRADRDARSARGKELAAAALAALAEDPERGVLLAIEAVRATRQSDGVVTPEAEGALHAALAASHSRLFIPSVGGPLAWSPDGSFVTTSGLQPGAIEMRANASGDLVRSFHAHRSAITDIAMSTDGRSFATTGEDGCLKVWETASGARTAELCGFGAAKGVSIDAGRASAVWPEEHLARVIEAATGAEVLKLEVQSPGDTSLDPAGQRIAVVADPQVEVYDLLGGRQVFAPIRVGANDDVWPIARVAWSPDGGQIATASGASADLWSALDGRHIAQFGYPGSFEDIAWSGDSRRLGTAGWDGAVRVWDAVDDRGRSL